MKLHSINHNSACRTIFFENSRIVIVFLTDRDHVTVRDVTYCNAFRKLIISARAPGKKAIGVSQSTNTIEVSEYAAFRK